VLRLLEGSRGGLRAADIRNELEREVTERTIFRDIKHLQAAGFALLEENGRWRVLAHGEGGYAVPVKPTELLALLLSKDLLRPIRSTEVASAFEELRKKVSAMLTPVGRRYAEDLAGSLVATFTAPGEYDARGAEIRLIEEAIQKEHSLRLSYWSPKGSRGEQTEREVDPYVLWFADGRLYLVGWCHLRRELRMFLVDRIRAVEVLDRSFDRDPGFDAREYIGRGFSVWHGESHDIRLLFRPEVAHLPRERRFHHTQQVHGQPDGSALLSMQAAGLPQLAAWIAGFGGLVRVQAPRVLADMVRELHLAGLEASGLKQPLRPAGRLKPSIRKTRPNARRGLLGD
jgi:predicted DNA-binding transcriptional regulator YafY